MTGLQHEREFSRRSFIKGGGALVVGFSLAGSGLAGKASAAIPTPAGYLPDPNQVDSWLTIGADNTATLKTSQIETGNGIMTGFLMVAAEELDMDLSQMRYGTDDTYIVVASGGEGGSNAIAGTAPPIRAAAVSARQALLGLASAQFGVPAASLTVSKGVVSGGGFQSTYGQLLGGKLFNVSMPPSYNMAAVGGFGPPTGLVAGQAPAKPIASYKLVGTSPPRIDIPAQGDRHLHLRPERARGRDAARPRRSSPRAGCLGSRAPRSSRSTRARSRTSRTCRSSRRGTSSASSPRRNGTRSRQPRS